MSSFSSDSQLSTNSDHLARAIKLSYCYITFYIVQIFMALTICSLLLLDRMDLVAFVEIPIAFFIVLDIILSHYVQARKQFCSKIQIINMLVLLGSVTTILLDLVIPHITQNRIHTVFNIIRILRFAIQFVWIIKLAYESKKLINSYNQNLITFDPNHQVEEQLAKMAL